jgi:hypothetical protein
LIVKAEGLLQTPKETLNTIEVACTLLLSLGSTLQQSDLASKPVEFVEDSFRCRPLPEDFAI